MLIELTHEQIQEKWTAFHAWAQQVADPKVWETCSRMYLTEQFVDLMKSFGYTTTDEEVYVATGFWEDHRLPR